MGVKTNRTSSLSGNRSVQHGTKKHKKKRKKNKNVKTCYLTNTNLTNTCKKTGAKSVSFFMHRTSHTVSVRKTSRYNLKTLKKQTTACEYVKKRCTCDCFELCIA